MDITSANAEIILTVPRLAINHKLQMFSVSNGWTLSNIEAAIAQKGIDGKMSAGWVPRTNALRYVFSPDSPSIPVMSAILSAQDTIRGIILIQTVISIPSIDRVYTCTNGVLTEGKIMPDGGRILEPQEFGVTYEDIKQAIR